jgi:hypothetical protein
MNNSTGEGPTATGGRGGVRGKKKEAVVFVVKIKGKSWENDNEETRSGGRSKYLP